MTNIALGDEEAFVALYRHRQDDVYRFAYAFSHSLSIAQDVTQEVFLGVLENAARYDTAKGSVRAWLLGSARHLAINHLRRDRRGATKLPNGVPSEEHTSCRGEDEVFHEQRLARLHEEISRLPFEFRDALVLCDMMELSYADSAAAMQCPVGTVRSRLHRARALLAERLGSGASEGASGAMNTDPLAIVRNGVR
jgi:RNA polymerase sigma-70 factor (ECF subfamily)